MNVDFTAEIKAIFKRNRPMPADFYEHYDDECDIPLPPVTPPVWNPLPVDSLMDSLTEDQKREVRDNFPSEEDWMVWWATPVLAATPVERRVLVAAKIEVLEGLVEDPEAWCRRALELAARVGGGHAD